MKIVANLMVLVVLGFVLTGCGPTRRIIYDDSEILPMDQTLPYSINIDIMDDRSNGDSLSTLPLRLDREDVFDDTRRCLNAENEYADIVIEKIKTNILIEEVIIMLMNLYNSYLDLLSIPRKLRTYKKWACLEDMYEELFYWCFSEIEDYRRC